MEQLERDGREHADADGIAALDSVRPGTYTVRFALPAQAEPAASGGAFTLQGSLMAHSGITVGEGETAQDISGGLVSRTSIGGDGPPYYPMARAIAGGLLFSTVISLIVLPTIYSLLDDASLWAKRVLCDARARRGSRLRITTQ